jgi:rhombotail lipoprotein
VKVERGSLTTNLLDVFVFQLSPFNFQLLPIPDAIAVAGSTINGATLNSVVRPRCATNAARCMNSSSFRRKLSGFVLVLGAALVFCAGCVSHRQRKKAERATSVVNYLYPTQANPLPPTSIPVLRLPLRVGIAFVPSGNVHQEYGANAPISELQKTALMDRVAAEFKGLEYIQKIEIIPTSYLRPGGGFDNLNQLRSMFGIDVIGLVAYDQVQFTNHNVLSLTYWTIAGAYLFHGNKNDTQTLMETAVYDIESRHLLFRAPGGSRVQAGAAAVYLPQRLRADSGKGFDTATSELIVNLKTQLEAFRTRVKEAPGEVKIEHKPGYTGAGAMSGGFAVVLLAGLGAVYWRRRSC